MSAVPQFLITPDVLESRLDQGILVIDCRHPDAFRERHISGAVSLPIDYWLKEKDQNGIARGMRLLSPGAFEDLAGSLGATPGLPIVTYDDNQGRAAARVWWVFRYHGHQDIKVLDGGWSRWLQEGRPTSIHVPVPVPARYQAEVQPGLMVPVNDLLSHPENFQIVDARSPEEWSGADAHGNARAGRIPGSINLDWSRFITPEPRQSFLPFSELKSIVDATGLVKDKPVVTYCQAGVRAAHVAFVLTMLGFPDVRIYDESMREWANRTDTPLEQGW